MGRLNFERPLIVSTLVGLALGDLEKGLIVGASLELMSLGLVNIGAAAPPDMNMASIIATSFAILSNANAEAALTIAIPISVLGQMLGILMRTILSNLTHAADKFIEQGKFNQARRIHIFYGTGLYALMYFIPIFMAIYFGTNLVTQVVEAIPQWLTDGLTVASKILPAYGFALLLQTMLTKKNGRISISRVLDHGLFWFKCDWSCGLCLYCGFCHGSSRKSSRQAARPRSIR